MKNHFLISDSEKSRILNLHESRKPHHGTSLLNEETEKPIKVKIIGGGKKKDAWYQDHIGKIVTVYKGLEDLAEMDGYEFLYEVLKNDENEKTLGREVRGAVIAPDAAEEI